MPQTRTTEGGPNPPIGFLTGDQIKRLQPMVNFDEKQVNQWSYDMRLGDEVYISSAKAVQRLSETDSVTIRPGETALLLTLEELRMPNFLGALITLRFSKKRKGLINVSGFHVDPGYVGKAVFSVHNAGPNPVVMRRGDPVFSIFFVNLGKDTGGRSPDAQHQNIQHLQADWIGEIAGPPVSLFQLKRTVDKLRFYTYGLMWLMGGIFTTGLAVWLGLAAGFKP